MAATEAARAPHRSRTAVCVFVVLAVLANWAGARALDARFRDFEGRRRPPAPAHLWPEWVRATEPKRPGERLVLVVTHSQGYGPELPQEAVYPALLGDELEARGMEAVRVVSWSVPAANAPEFVILLAAAQRLDPDITLLVAGPQSFARLFRIKDEKPRPLRYGRTDVRFLLGYADVRRHLPPAFAEFYVDVHEQLDALLARVLPLWRYREIGQELFWWKPLRPFSGERSPPGWLRPQVEPLGRPSGDVARLPLDRRLAEFVAEAFAALPGRRIFVENPVHSSLRHYLLFSARMKMLLESRGIEYWNLENAVDDERFLTRAHIDREGHAQVARMLAERIAP